MSFPFKVVSEFIFWSVHIPLLLVICLVGLYVCKKKLLLAKELEQLSTSTIPLEESKLHRKNIRIINCTINILIFILLIEFLPNAFAVVSEVTIHLSIHFNTTPYDNYSISNSCRLIYVSEYAANRMHYADWIFIPLKLSLSSHLLLIPSLCLLLKFLRRAYLGHNYLPVLKNWSIYLLIRSIALFLLMSFFQTYWLFQLIETFLYLFDYCIFLSYARIFYRVLLSRKNEAYSHYGAQEYYERLKILKRYRLTIVLITLPITLLVFQVVMENILILLNLLLANGCYFNFITDGLIPTINIPHNEQILGLIQRRADVLWLFISIFRKSMLILLYLALLLVGSVDRLVRFRRATLRELVTPLLRRNNT